MADNRSLPTEFAPAERTDQAELMRQTQLFTDNVLLRQLLDSVPDIVMVVNQQRQVIFANQAMLEVLGVDSVEDVYGLRPGEALNCAHATENESGCGTTAFCRTCGAVRAILTSLRGEENVDECRITRADGKALDLRVWAKPIEADGLRFSTFAVQDISHEKRRHALERIFFHDILNTAGTLRGFAEVMEGMSFGDADNARRQIHRLSQKLIDEIDAQRQLLIAEAHQLAVDPMMVRSLAALDDVVSTYRGHHAARERDLRIAPDAEDVQFITDATLLSRVLSNLVKNALEAIGEGDVVTVSSVRVDDSVEFSVHNPGFIPLENQLQIFQRSFSTKGEGRGLGTYSVRLISERYLAGQVWFTSTPEDGTIFKARYPLQFLFD